MGSSQKQSLNRAAQSWADESTERGESVDLDDADQLAGYEYPESWDDMEDARLISLLKRGTFGVRLNDGYRRFPRLKEHIIPFYSYGNDFGFMGRNKPSLVTMPKPHYGYSPWNPANGNHGNRFLVRGRDWKSLK
ncbi:uncharacterized protein LOC127879611 isoform X2 [Dreissena polymorpha]|uniref:uncharacterized protein LOC127875934 isoform X2 n=1 Tax=Dreissena polymorpha TaxID=45954 RepID=UPI002263D298|nr:uncharacterized protein LOC127875934 isoform X2 [Dreissena polymorpha]XP_052282529.1 uncharacterized protein LOC127879611 isoform X2 [Dreissena polymorpha]